jgi:hypothetical protein
VRFGPAEQAPSHSFSRPVEIDDMYAKGWSGLADALKALGQDEKAERARSRAESLKSEDE